MKNNNLEEIVVEDLNEGKGHVEMIIKFTIDGKSHAYPLHWFKEGKHILYGKK